MVRVGIAGIGFMGMIHYLAYEKARGVKTHAIQSSNSKKRSGDWRGIQGNFGPSGAQMELGKVRAYVEFDELLSDPAIDVVDLCTPPGTHAEMAIAALRSGKHVFCEKPIALTTRDAKRMVQAAQKSGKQLMIGHVLPFFPEFSFARKAIVSGKYGRLLGAHFKRIISDPLWIKDFYNPNTVGGPLLDLHIHDAHFIRLVHGLPKAVSSAGRMRGEVVEFVESRFEYEDPNILISATSGVINQQGRAFAHGFEVHLEKATLLFDFAVIGGQPRLLMPLTVLNHQGKVVEPKLAPGDPISSFVAELTEMARAVRTDTLSEILDGELALDALAMCHAETTSVIKRKRVQLR